MSPRMAGPIGSIHDRLLQVGGKEGVISPQVGPGARGNQPPVQGIGHPAGQIGRVIVIERPVAGPALVRAHILAPLHVMREEFHAIPGFRSGKLQPHRSGHIGSISGYLSGQQILLPFLGHCQGDGHPVLHFQGQGYRPGGGGIIGPVGEDDAVLAAIPLGWRYGRPVPCAIRISEADRPCPARTDGQEGAACRRP